MITETATNRIKRKKVMSNRFAMLSPIAHNSDVYRYDRDASGKSVLIQLGDDQIDQIENGDFSSLEGLGIAKILEEAIKSIAYGAKLTEVFDEEGYNLTSEHIMVLEFEASAKMPFSMMKLDKY